MVSTDKFYIYGGGRWREVDTGTGRIDGWGRANFLVARNGKLEAMRSRPVLAALRALAEQKPSPAKEGPQLSYKYPRHKSLERVRPGCEHQCCHHSSSGTCTKISKSEKASVAIQCDKLEVTANTMKNNTAAQTHKRTSTPNVSTDLRKRKISSSSENLFHTKVVTVATVHSPRKDQKPDRTHPKNSQIRKRRDSSDSISTIKLTQSPGLKRKHSSKSQSEMQPRKVRKSFENLRRSTRKNVSIVISDDDDKSSTDEPLINLGTKRTRESIEPIKISPKTDKFKSRLGPKSLKDDSIKSMLDEESSDNRKRKPGPSRNLDLNETGKRRKKDMEYDELTPKSNDKLIKLSPKRNTNDESLGHTIRPRRNAKEDRTIDVITSQDVRVDINNIQDSKELIIDEKDVEILRLFLLKHCPDEDIIRFDTDDEYKKMHFYRINPLVNVQRCPRIARMIRDSNDDKISLVDFASKLGLRSVSETSSVKRYKTRKRVEKNDEEVGKENGLPNKLKKMDSRERSRKERKIKVSKKDGRKERTEKDINDELSSDEQDVRKVEPVRADRRRPTKATKKKERENNIDDVESSSGSEETRKDSVDGRKEKDRNNVTKEDAEKKEKFRRERDNATSGNEKERNVIKKKAVSKRPPLNEYSNLEDHAIVSWVSLGSRACSVNGNRIWVELQDQFHQITGNARTWHSLRNRYLRYILPRLGALALPPSLQTRLRAAAATGELKAKRNKRNSIFKPAVVGAASRRPGLETEKGDETESPPKTRDHALRYSDVTRQFALKHRYSSERSSQDPHKSRRQSPDKSGNKSLDKSSNRSLDKSSKKSPRKSRISDKSEKRSNEQKLNENSDSSDILSDFEPYSVKKSDRKSDESKNKSDSTKSKNVKTNKSDKTNRKQSSENISSMSSDSETLHTDKTSDSEDMFRRNPARLRSSSVKLKSPKLRRSNRIISPEPKKSNRIQSPRKFSRIQSPSKHDSSDFDSEDKSIRQNKTISPERNSLENSRIRKQNTLSGKRDVSPANSSQRKSNRYKSETDNSALPNGKGFKTKRTRKLYNPKHIM